MKTFKQLREEVAANAVGGGHVAALGVGPMGEPPAKPKSTKKKVFKRKSPLQ